MAIGGFACTRYWTWGTALREIPAYSQCHIGMPTRLCCYDAVGLDCHHCVCGILRQAYEDATIAPTSVLKWMDLQAGLGGLAPFFPDEEYLSEALQKEMVNVVTR